MTFYVAPESALAYPLDRHPHVRPAGSGSGRPRPGTGSRPGTGLSTGTGSGLLRHADDLLCLNIPWQDCDVEGEIEARIRFHRR